jgi:hypothetical protein
LIEELTPPDMARRLTRLASAALLILDTLTGAGNTGIDAGQDTHQFGDLAGARRGPLPKWFSG